MEPLKPRDKVTQHMTRDGLTLDNQTTGESVNVSSREAEQEYTAQPEGAAEKILERAGELHDRHKAKKAAKDAGKTVAQATGPVSRLQFTAEERASPELAPYIKKAEKRADKLEAAKEALPKKRVVTKETVYDEAKGKAKSRLYFDKVEKASPQFKPNPASRPIQEAGLYLHGKIHEVEHENVGVEGGHKGEELAERQAGRMIRSGVHRHKLKPYRAAAKAERKSIAANAEFVYQKSLRNNPELAQAAKNPVSRFWQKQHIKQEYAKAARAAGQTAQGAASTAKTTAAAAMKAAEKSRQAASFAARHWKGALIVGGVGLMLLLVMGGLQSCTAMFGSTGTGLAATSYLSEDSDMLGAEAAYAALEADLQHELDNYESLHPGYDEYRFDLDEIKHDPYDEQCPVYGGTGSKGKSRGTDFPFGCGRGSQGGGPKAQADPQDDAETKETVHPGAACRRQGGTEKEAPGAGKIKRNGGMRNVFHRGRRKPDLSVPQCRPPQDGGKFPGSFAGHGQGNGGAGLPDRQ